MPKCGVQILLSQAEESFSFLHKGLEGIRLQGYLFGNVVENYSK